MKEGKKPRTGVYRTEYGNAAVYIKGNLSCYDLDMAERIPLEMVDFDDYIRDVEEADRNASFRV
jgi:hypothetical protein